MELQSESPYKFFGRVMLVLKKETVYWLGTLCVSMKCNHNLGRTYLLHTEATQWTCRSWLFINILSAKKLCKHENSMVESRLIYTSGFLAWVQFKSLQMKEATEKTKDTMGLCSGVAGLAKAQRKAPSLVLVWEFCCFKQTCLRWAGWRSTADVVFI